MCKPIGLHAISVLLIVPGLVFTATTTEEQAPAFREIPGLYEPSGVVQLDDTNLLIIEDEPDIPFSIARLEPDFSLGRVSRLKPASLFEAITGRINDLEGITTGPDGHHYAITSHSRDRHGKRDRQREKILRFRVDRNRLSNSIVRSDLRKSLLRAFPELKPSAKSRDVKNDSGLNIEGLSFDRSGIQLWIGFRAPLIDEKALIVTLENPETAMERDEDYLFKKTPILLDLDGGGIRDIAYDKKLDGYLILSQKEGTKKQKAFKLWFWQGDELSPPVRVKIKGVKNLQRAEGVTSVTSNGQQYLLLLSDDGNRLKRNPAHYILVGYDQLDFIR